MDEPLTKKDLLESLAPLARASDLANVEKKLDDIMSYYRLVRKK